MFIALRFTDRSPHKWTTTPADVSTNHARQHRSTGLPGLEKSGSDGCYGFRDAGQEAHGRYLCHCTVGGSEPEVWHAEGDQAQLQPLKFNQYELNVACAWYVKAKFVEADSYVDSWKRSKAGKTWSILDECFWAADLRGSCDIDNLSLQLSYKRPNHKMAQTSNRKIYGDSSALLISSKCHCGGDLKSLKLCVQLVKFSYIHLIQYQVLHHWSSLYIPMQ